MLKLSTRQHSQILGWSLIAFGVGNALELLRLGLTLGSAGNSRNAIGVVFASVVAQLCYAILGVFAGMAVFDLRNPIRGLLILFAVVAFLSFPLGTVLSVYVLFYVYVINTAPALPVYDKENSEAIGESQ